MKKHYAQLLFNRRVKLPLILQDECADCGHACIAMIGNYWGHRLNLLDLKRTWFTSTRGITLADIRNMFTQLGFNSRALRVPIEEIKHIKCPAILHWNMNHFVVLKTVRANTVIIHDPAFGVRRCSLKDMMHSFTGIVLEVEKSNDFKALRATNTLSLWQLVYAMRGIAKFMVFLVVLSVVLELLSLLNPLFIQYITDNVIGFCEASNVWVIATGFAILVAMQSFVEYMRSRMAIYLTNNLNEQFATQVMKHLLTLPLSFFERRYQGDIQTKFQGIQAIQRKLSTDFVNTVLDGLLVVLNLLVMVIYSRLLSVVVVLAMGINLLMRYACYHHLHKQTETSVLQHARASSVFLETLKGIIPIKSYMKESVRLNVWRNHFVEALNADIRVASVNLTCRVVEQLLTQFEHIVVVCAGAALVLANQFSLGMLMAFLSYRLLFLGKAFSFLHQIIDYKLVTIQLRRLGDILLQQPEPLGQINAPLQRNIARITLQQVCFKYNPQDGYVFKDINLTIQSGEKVAIIGASGCGKTTLLKVMMGLLPVTEGEIYLDSLKLADYGVSNYRSLTASVMQDDALLSGSILDNIAFFAEEIDMQQIYLSAKLACIHDVICQLPMGYETLIGDMGSTLSGGQKQRILLARALYKKPSVLFLDEATSHLDVPNEIQINQALKQLAMTQIIIAHRQETISMADRVIDLSRLSV